MCDSANIWEGFKSEFLSDWYSVLANIVIEVSPSETEERYLELHPYFYQWHFLLPANDRVVYI